MSPDTCVTIVPYFKLKPGQADAFRALTTRLIATAQTEEGCLFYGFSYCEDIAHCREGYASAEDLLQHLQNVAPLIEESAQCCDLTRIEIHGIASELEKLREPLHEMPAQFFTLEAGFRR